MSITCLSTVSAANQPRWGWNEEKKEDDMYNGVWEKKEGDGDV